MQKQSSWAIAGLSLALAFGLAPRVGYAQSPDYPYQGQANFTLDGTVSSVDVDRDRVAFDGDNGQSYTLDTYHSQITLRITSKPGTTADLVPGMRLHIVGTLASQTIIEANQVTVLPFRSERPLRPVSPSAPVVNSPEPITLRGTVQSVDTGHDRFVVTIGDHTRTIYINDQTDLEDVDYGGSGSDIPLHAGDRVNVAGTFRPDGTVLATSVHGIGIPSGPDDSMFAPLGRTLTGPVTSQSNKYASRDIKVRVAADREVTVHVPHDAKILRDGRGISVHDLSKNDVVRIQGTPDGSDYKASRIEVLRAGDPGE